jgi:hypothetical protein
VDICGIVSTDPKGLEKLLQEDVNIMKDIGIDGYRFSISWTRILPSNDLSSDLKQIQPLSKHSTDM